MRGLLKIPAALLLILLNHCTSQKGLDNIVTINNKLIKTKLETYINTHNISNCVVTLTIYNRKKYSSLVIQTCDNIDALKHVRACYYTFIQKKPIAIAIGAAGAETSLICDQKSESMVPTFAKNEFLGSIKIDTLSYTQEVATFYMSGHLSKKNDDIFLIPNK